MLIDWRTVAAQLVNFLLLVWFLNRFLFRPVQAIVKERNETMKKALDEAASQHKAALAERETFAREKESFEEQKSSLLRAASTEAHHEKERLVREAHDEYAALRATLRTHSEEDKKRLATELKGTIEDEAFRLAQTALVSLSSASLEEQMVVRFAQAVRQMGEEEKKSLLFDLSRSSYAAVVRTAFELPAPSRAFLEKTLTEFFAHPLACTFECDPSLIGGVEMMTAGHTVGWNLSSALLSIREAV